MSRKEPKSFNVVFHLPAACLSEHMAQIETSESVILYVHVVKNAFNTAQHIQLARHTLS